MLYWAAVVAMGLTAILVSVAVRNPAILSAQTVEPSVVQESDASDNTDLRSTTTEPDSIKVDDTELDSSSKDLEVQRQLNELRRELLNARAETIDWWLAAVAIFVTLFGVGAAIAGYISFNRFREIEAEASRNVRNAEERYLEAQ